MPNFYPRPPRGGRPLPWAAEAMSWAISIHALREEGDEQRHQLALWYRVFLSTPSARRATLAVKNSCVHEAISIHALREEGDQRQASLRWPAPRFLSTPSARRATWIPAASQQH